MIKETNFSIGFAKEVTPGGRDRESAGGFQVNEGLVSDIKRHFDEEIRIKKRIFEMELQSDDVEDKILQMKSEMNIETDKVLKDRYEEYLNIQKRLPHQAEELKRDFGILSGKRSQLNDVRYRDLR